MKQTASLVLALAGASPALADTNANNEMRLRNDGLPAGAVATGQNAEAALAEGRSLLAAGNAAQAISAFRLALGQDNQSLAALNGIAIAYDRLGRIDLARQHFEMALAIDPDAADIAYNLGWTLHRSGQQRDAIPWLQRASAGNDGRAAASARRALLLVAAALEAGSVTAAPQGNAQVRVAAARIDMASSGEAVLVLSGPVAHPAASPRVVVAQAATQAEVSASSAPRLAGGVPAARLAAQLKPTRTTVPQLAAPLTLAAAEPTETPAITNTALSGFAVDLMVEGQLGDLAALTIPIATLAAADPAAKDAGASLALPQVISITDAPPELPTFASIVPFAPLLALQATELAPLRLLDLAALPELATAAPMAPRPLLSVAAVAVDWLAGFDASRFVEDPVERARGRLSAALAAQADLTAVDDKDAVRMAIARLEALVARIGALSA